MLEPQPLRRLGQPLGFVGFELLWLSPADSTKTAGTGADISQHHKGGGLLRVALHPVGAFGVFAHRFQP